MWIISIKETWIWPINLSSHSSSDISRSWVLLSFFTLLLLTTFIKIFWWIISHHRCYFTPREFFMPDWVFYRIDCKLHQVSRTLLRFLVNLNNAVIGVMTILPPITNSDSLSFKLLETVPSLLTVFGCTVTFMFHSFFSSQARSNYLLIFSLSFFSVVRMNIRIYQMTFFSSC